MSDAIKDESKNDDDIFRKIFHVNQIEIHPIANFQIDDFTSIGVTHLFGRYVVHTSLDEENVDWFIEYDDAMAKARQLAAEFVSWHIKNADD